MFHIHVALLYIHLPLIRSLYACTCVNRGYHRLHSFSFKFTSPDPFSNTIRLSVVILDATLRISVDEASAAPVRLGGAGATDARG